MVKHNKNKKKIHIEGFVGLLFIISCIAFFFSVTYFRSQNVLLTRQSNDIERNNDTLAKEVASLEVEVKQLDSRDRILEIVNEYGLKVNQESIVSVVSDTAQSE